MASDNLSLWKSVEKTDPQQTTKITGKPYRGDSPKPYSLIHRATEKFGPIGIGWGFSIKSERVEDAAPGDRVHIAHVEVWYKWQGEIGRIEHIGGTMIAGKNKNGPYSDDDAAKKSVTDALVKALSLLGFAGDIFMGRFDDSKYVAEVREEFANQKRTEALPTVADYVDRSLRAIAMETTRAGLISYWDGEKKNRADLDIIDGSDEFKKLYQAYVAKGQGFSLDKIAARPGRTMEAA